MNSWNQSSGGESLLLAHSACLSDCDRLHTSKPAQRLGFTIDLRPFQDIDVQAAICWKMIIWFMPTLAKEGTCGWPHQFDPSSIRCSPKVWDNFSYSRWAATSGTWTWSAPWRRSSDCRRKPVLWGKKTSSSRLVLQTTHSQFKSRLEHSGMFHLHLQLGRV